MASLTMTAQTVTDIDGNVYPTVGIGAQTWMAANLVTTRYQNGDTIPNVTNSTTWQNLSTGARCYYDDDSLSYAPVYGALYNWYAAADARNICPVGWHVPTDLEWNTMTVFLDPTVNPLLFGTPTGTDIGGQLKEADTTHWTAPNTGATNASGFTALPAGERLPTVFSLLNTSTWFWTSTPGGTPQHAWMRVLSNTSAQIQRITYSKINGLSCRCMQDLTTALPERGTDDEGCHLYPVPASDRLTITAIDPAIRNVRVFDPLGRCALELPVGTGPVSLDLRELPPGLYSVWLSGPGVVVRRSFVKE